MFHSIIHALKGLLKKPFKVGLITYYYPEKNKINNGVAIHTYYLSRELAKLGCEVHVFTKSEKNSLKKEYIGEGKIVIHRIETKFNFPIADMVVRRRIEYFIFDNKIINEVTKENEHERFNIIHTHGWFTAGAFISKYFTNVKWVHTFHSLEKDRMKFLPKEEKKYFKIIKWMESTIEYADGLIAVSKKLKEDIIKQHPTKEKDTYYIPNGVDIEIFKPENIPSKYNTILCITRFTTVKGIDLIPKIAIKVLTKDPKSKFVIVVADENILDSLEKTKQQIETLEKTYPERFIWHRKSIERKDLAKMYNESSIYIQPSRWDSFPTTVLEAMACGKAVICSNKGGMPEMVENAGIIIPFNSNVFAKNILRLLEDYKIRERYGKRATKKVQKFSWDLIANQTLDLYKAVTKTKEEKEETGEVLKDLEELHKKDEKMENKPKLSIIIPLYNSKRYIKETIESILSQNFKDFEIIIIDDASNDESLKIIENISKKDKRIRVLKNKTNKGKAGTVNVGFKYTKGRYITFSDADDIFYQERLKKQVEFLDAHPEIDMIYGNIIKFWKDGKEKIYSAVEFKNTEEALLRLKKESKKTEKIQEGYKILDSKKYIPGTSIMFKRKIIDSGIKMDENLRNSEDCDFNFQIIGKGYKIMKMPIITFKYRKHPNQKSGNQENMKKATHYILNKLRKGGYFK